MTAFALSPACAGPLAGVGFRTIVIAERPDEGSLLDRLSEPPRARLGWLFWLMIAMAAVCIATGAVVGFGFR